MTLTSGAPMLRLGVLEDVVTPNRLAYNSSKIRSFKVYPFPPLHR